MNCKPGDLALVVDAKNDKSVIGWIVRVVSRAPRGTILYRNGHPHQEAKGDDAWLVAASGREWLHSESRLRPLRDNDGEDEMIRIAGLPHKEHA